MKERREALEEPHCTVVWHLRGVKQPALGQGTPKGANYERLVAWQEQRVGARTGTAPRRAGCPTDCAHVQSQSLD